ncbi:MAG: hypothetical protein ACOC1F_05425, partial [Myxococcota bacterium]
GIARVLSSREEIDEARTHLHHAMSAFQAAGMPSGEAATWLAFAETEALHAQHEAAVPLVERAIAWFERLGDPDGEALARCACTRIQLDLGGDGAVAEQIAAIRRLPLSKQHPAVLEADLLHAVAAHQAGNANADAYTAVELAARHQGTAPIESEALAFQALARAQSRQFGQAHALFRAALDAGLRRNAQLWAAIAAAFDARVAPSAPIALSCSRSAQRQGAVAALLSLAATPSQWAQTRQELMREGAKSVVLRLAIRALDQTGMTHTPAAIPNDALAVGQHGGWFRMPGGEVVSLERRRPLARLLARLVQARCEERDEALSWDALQKAGWPGERIMATAGAHRVRVGISTLRKLGLRDAVQTTPDGYKLSSALAVVYVDAAEAVPP